MKEKKIRVTIPDYLFKAVKTDQHDFALNSNKLCNLVFSLYYEKALKIDSIFKSKYNGIIQFNLNVENIALYDEVIRNNRIFNEADFFRKMFYLYADQPKYKRELQLYKENVLLIKSSIQKKRKLKIWYKEEFRNIEPYFFSNSDGESRNFIFCWCYKNNDYRNYRLINIKPIAVLNEVFQKDDETYLNKIKINFDPFLSYGKTVKVHLTEKGELLYHKIVTNRPKIIDEHNSIYTFECSEDKAKLYFSQFLDEAEILEPSDLREWFKNKYQSVLKKYKKK